MQIVDAEHLCYCYCNNSNFLSSEHLQRAVLWPGYPTTATAVQPSLQVTTTQQPATQHIQLFESTEPPDYLAAPGTRILVQPQLTIATAAAATATAVTVGTDTTQNVAKRTTKQATTLIKIEPAHTVSEQMSLFHFIFICMLENHERKITKQL